MEDNTVFVREYDEAEGLSYIDKREILRYSGYPPGAGTVDEAVYGLLKEVVGELKGAFSYRVCYRRMPVTWEGGMPRFLLRAESTDLARCLEGSTEAILFAATIGLKIDRYIARYQRLSPAKALIAQGYGAERVEALCGVFCDGIKAMAKDEGLACTPRFSPGYGDLPLESQRDVFSLLDCSRKIGISLNESLLMTPSKSVTAVFGLKKDA
ncbi:MAG TPA: Vitamin B12 dependent methionine synthase activation subunit [Lachnospiraceae bacterium]|nr:Vitamin B12 dependent methionine synthase activation subunit [Lachnospiraceae bacterium]